MAIQITQAKKAKEGSMHTCRSCSLGKDVESCGENNFELHKACTEDLSGNYYPTDFIITD